MSNPNVERFNPIQNTAKDAPATHCKKEHGANQKTEVVKNRHGFEPWFEIVLETIRSFRYSRNSVHLNLITQG